MSHAFFSRHFQSASALVDSCFLDPCHSHKYVSLTIKTFFVSEIASCQVWYFCCQKLLTLTLTNLEEGTTYKTAVILTIQTSVPASHSAISTAQQAKRMVSRHVCVLCRHQLQDKTDNRFAIGHSLSIICERKKEAVQSGAVFLLFPPPTFHFYSYCLASFSKFSHSWSWALGVSY